MFRLYFYPVADSYLLVIAVAMALAAALMLLAVLGLLGLLGVQKKLDWLRQSALLALRAGVIAMVILAMLRPTLVYTRIRKQPATLVMLIDQSRSMSVRDAFGGKSRWEALCRAVAEAEGPLAELAQDFELRAYTFDAQPHPLKVEGGKIPLPQAPEGKQTAIGASLGDVLQQLAGKRLLGVILLSDGAQRAFAQPDLLARRDLPPQEVAAGMKHLGQPLYSVAFGQSRGLGQAQDLAVKDLLVAQSVFVKNELIVVGQVRADGYVNREITVRLLFETAPGKIAPVAEQKIRVTTDGQLLPVRIGYIPQHPGEHKLTLEVVPQPGELVTTNNQLSTFVHVLKGGLNVLYLEGGLRVEQKFLRRSLDASPDIKVDFVRIDAQRPETRPADLSERFQPGKYEVYILGDLDATAFRPKDLKDLAEAVHKGAGLIMLGGFHSFGPGGYASTELAKVLPVRMNDNERQMFDAAPRPDVHLPGPLRMQPTELGWLRFPMSLAGSREENAALWAKLPPLEGANKLSPTGLAAGAEVLADDGKGSPLLVAHQYGDGRVLAFAGDSTWHWWMRGLATAHKRFWRQVVLWLAQKDKAGEGTVWVKLEKRRFAPSERVEFSLGALSASGEPVKDADFEVKVVLPDGTRRPLRPVRQGEQTIGSFREAQAPGDYAIEVSATHRGAPLGSARARFLVHEQDLELDNAAADTATMQSLAAMTGGESIAPEQLPELIERLTSQTEYLDVPQETKKTFWDSWPFFLMLVVLLTVDWSLRKSWGLV